MGYSAVNIQQKNSPLTLQESISTDPPSLIRCVLSPDSHERGSAMKLYIVWASVARVDEVASWLKAT